jgi:SHS2 domain-containing protein
MKKYTFLPHTADIGLEAHGATLSELFINAAEGLFALIGAKGDERNQARFRVRLEATATDELLINWLNELVYLSSVKRIVGIAFVPLQVAPAALAIDVTGAGMRADAPPLREIKAATYHNISVEKTPRGFNARIIFDV